MKTTDTDRLVVVPFRDEAITRERVCATLQTLMRRGVVEADHAVVANWRGSDLCLAPAIDDERTLVQSGQGPRWRAVLKALFDRHVIEWIGAPIEADASVPPVDDYALSTSFVREVRESVLPGTTFLALVVKPRETSTIVHEVGRVRASRMIYGAVPSNWFSSVDGFIG
jgi:uncharacterized membrane protein